EKEGIVVAAAAQRRQLRFCIAGADLCGVGDVDQPGGDHVLRAVGPEHGLHQFRRQLAVGGAGRADLVAGGLDGAGFVDVDVAGVGGNGRLIGPQVGGDGDEVYLGAAHQEVDVRL